MEKLADTIENLLEKKLFLYQELEKILEQEKKHIVDMDVDSLWKTIAKKRVLVSKLEPLNTKMNSLLEKRASELSIERSSFKLSDLIKKLPVSKQFKSNLRTAWVCLETIKKHVSDMAIANKNYINESLTVINGVFSVISDTVDKEQYNQSGNLLKSSETNRLINAEV